MNKQIKVLLVGPIPPPFGGIPYYVKTLFESGINKVDFNLFNTALPASIAPLNREGKRSYTSLYENGIWVAIKKISFVLFSFPLLAFTILHKRPHIVQVFTPSYWGYWRSWIYILISKILRRKTIFHLLNAIDIFYRDSGAFQKYWLRRSLNIADEYLVQSPKLRKWVQQYSSRSVKSLWNGLFFNHIPSKTVHPPKFMASFDRPVGITIGGLGKNKGAAEIINAVARIKSEQIDLGWVFVGGGDVEHFRALADSRGLSENISFTGFISESEKWQYLHHANFFCLPSIAEGQPISILEAMAVGLPILATSVGSIPEVVGDGVEGFIIPPLDTSMLINKIKTLIQEPENSRRMGEKARQTARERHDIKILFKNMRSVYFEILTI